MAKDWKKVIPKQFWRGRHPAVRTVGDLKAQLALLPDDLVLDRGLGRKSRRCVVYNIDTKPMFDLSDLY